MTCPYNNHHRVKSSRYFQHLSSCAAQNPHIKLKQCPFNASHRILEAELANHTLNCPDNLAALRAFYEKAKAKADVVKNDPFDLKKEVTKEEEDDEDDPWAEEYIDKDKMSTMNYDILATKEVTAQWLFDKRFNGDDFKNFTDTIYIQKMSHEERRKYQVMCVEKIKEIKKLAKQNSATEELASVVSSQSSDDRPNEVVVKKRKIESANASIRKPNTLPFDNPKEIGIAIGIGRGRPKQVQ